MRAEGARHDVLSAVFARTIGRRRFQPVCWHAPSAVAALLGTETGDNLLTAYRRAANILRIEARKDGPHNGPPDPALLREPEEQLLAHALDSAEPGIRDLLTREDYHEVHRPDGESSCTARRVFRSALPSTPPNPNCAAIACVCSTGSRATMDRVADFSRIEG